MSNFAFRISKPYSDVDLTELYELCDKAVIYEHIADDEVSRTHIHGVLIGCQRKEDTLRNKFFKGIYEKQDYELKSSYKTNDGKKLPVNEEYIVYMSKGILIPEYHKGYTVEEINEYRLKWKAPKTMVKVVDGKFVLDKKEPKKKTKYELLDIMRERYKGLSVYQRDDLDAVLDIISEVLCENKEVLGEYKCKDYYDSLMMYENRRKWRDSLRRRIERN